jgi:hypothetical protein
MSYVTETAGSVVFILASRQNSTIVATTQHGNSKVQRVCVMQHLLVCIVDGQVNQALRKRKKQA